MKRRSLTFGLWLLAASVPGSLHAQAMNPTTAQFGASADHSATASDGTPAVTGYELDFYFVGALQPFRALPLGKPTPDANNNINVNLATVLGGFIPLPGIMYESRVLAVGPGGSGVSAVSNTFEYAVACSFSVSPATMSIGKSGGPSSVTVTTTAGCAWAAGSNASWLTVTSSAGGNGSATVNYTAAANTATSSRGGTLTIAGQTVTVTQAASLGGPIPTPGNLHILTGR